MVPCAELCRYEIMARTLCAAAPGSDRRNLAAKRHCCKIQKWKNSLLQGREPDTAANRCSSEYQNRLPNPQGRDGDGYRRFFAGTKHPQRAESHTSAPCQGENRG